MVYIQEAHPVDGWQQEANVKEKISVATPKSYAERCAVAETCATKLELHVPAVIDDVQNSTEAAYTAWPDRLYVIDRDGHIAYKSQPGPYGFRLAEVGDALRRFLPSGPRQSTQIR